MEHIVPCCYKYTFISQPIPFVNKNWFDFMRESQEWYDVSVVYINSYILYYSRHITQSFVTNYLDKAKKLKSEFCKLKGMNMCDVFI